MSQTGAADWLQAGAADWAVVVADSLSQPKAFSKLSASFHGESRSELWAHLEGHTLARARNASKQLEKTQESLICAHCIQ